MALDEAVEGLIASGVFLAVFFALIIILLGLTCHRRYERIRRKNAWKDFAKLSNQDSSAVSSKGSSYRKSQLQGYRPKIIGKTNNNLSQEQLVATDIGELVERREEDITQNMVHNSANLTQNVTHVTQSTTHNVVSDHPGVSIISVNGDGSSNYGNGYIVRGYDARRSANENGQFVYGHHSNQHGQDEVRQGWISVRQSHHADGDQQFSSGAHQIVTGHIVNQTESARVVGGQIANTSSDSVVRAQVIKQTVELGQDGKLQVMEQKETSQDMPQIVQGHFSRTVEVGGESSHVETVVKEERPNLGHLVILDERHVEDWPTATEALENAIAVEAPTRSRDSSTSSSSSDEFHGRVVSGFGAVASSSGFGEVSVTRDETQESQHHKEFISDPTNYKPVARPHSPHPVIPGWLVSQRQDEVASRGAGLVSTVVNTEESTSHFEPTTSSSVTRVEKVFTSTTTYGTGDADGGGFQGIIGQIRDESEELEQRRREAETSGGFMAIADASSQYGGSYLSHHYPAGTAHVSVGSRTESDAQAAEKAQGFSVVSTVVKGPIEFEETTTRSSGEYISGGREDPVSASIVVGSRSETERAPRFGVIDTVVKGPIEFEQTATRSYSGAYEESRASDGKEYITNFTSMGEVMGAGPNATSTYVIEDFVDPGPSTSRVVAQAQRVVESGYEGEAAGVSLEARKVTTTTRTTSTYVEQVSGQDQNIEETYHDRQREPHRGSVGYVPQ